MSSGNSFFRLINLFVDNNMWVSCAVLFLFLVSLDLCLVEIGRYGSSGSSSVMDVQMDRVCQAVRVCKSMHGTIVLSAVGGDGVLIETISGLLSFCAKRRLKARLIRKKRTRLFESRFVGNIRHAYCIALAKNIRCHRNCTS